MSPARLACPLVLALFLSRPTAALDMAGGGEFGFLSVPVLTPDPYSFAATAGLWYELGGTEKTPISLGAWLDLAGFRPLNDAFGASVMYYGGLELGYSLGLFRLGDTSLRLSPLARFGWYFRNLSIGGREEWASRPYLSSGALLDFRTGDLDLGLSILFSVPLENHPVLLVGFLQRIGLCPR